MENKIKVYVKLDKDKIVKEINSAVFLEDTVDWIKIDEGNGDKYAHAQSQYLEKGLMDGKGRYNYKYDTSLVELAEAEKEILFPPLPPQPTEIYLMKQELESQDKVIEELMFSIVPEITGGGI